MVPDARQVKMFVKEAIVIACCYEDQIVCIDFYLLACYTTVMCRNLADFRGVTHAFLDLSKFRVQVSLSRHQYDYVTIDAYLFLSIQIPTSRCVSFRHSNVQDTLKYCYNFLKFPGVIIIK
jgi:hypothetical protein